ncbi:MAG TPA: hypothetical protein LFV91_04525 [Rickettsia endosymbiont of Bembidion nr. Transversale]|nr:hypothetical protein [Rickettsia endosymbiont of Bembidion nr. Transversale]
MYSTPYSILPFLTTTSAPRSYNILVALGVCTGNGSLIPLSSATIAGVLPLKS